MEDKKIFDHSELAKHIKGKSVLLLNSFGKDCAVCLHWLSKYASPAKIVSVNFEFISKHPDDDIYLKWQKKMYPNVEFIVAPNAHELANIVSGIYQEPDMKIKVLNEFEHEGFSMGDHARDIAKRMGLDFVCMGHSKYESMARASAFYKKGILRKEVIYPIGMMTKKEILGIIKKTNIKLHPSYRFTKSTYDFPSYYKMRSAFISNPEYKKNVLKAYPLLELDIYRYEKILKSKIKRK